MRVIANNVEYFDLMRDHVPLFGTQDRSYPDTPSNGSPIAEGAIDRGLRDSLWFFDGNHVQCWLEIEDLLESAAAENDRELPQTVSISTDFYPSSVVLNKGIILGVDADLVQRRDVNFAFFRLGVRVSTMPLCSVYQLSRFRPNSSSLRSYADTSRFSTQPRPPDSPTATSLFLTFPTRSKSSYTRSSTRKSTAPLHRPIRCCPLCYRFLPTFHPTSISSCNARAKPKFALGALCLRISLPLKRCSKRLWRRAC